MDREPPLRDARDVAIGLDWRGATRIARNKRQMREEAGHAQRDRDILATVRRLDSQPLVGVVAPSGAGKSSFIRAGVIPALRESGDDWEVLISRPGRDPMSGLASVLMPVISTQSTSITSTRHATINTHRQRTS